MKDGRLSIKRGYSLPINVTPNITPKDLLEKAVAKHTHFHKDVVQSNKKAFYQLLYADKSKVSTLPGSDEPFTLKSYKEEIDKPYSRITFYLCSSSDYFDSVLHDFDLDSDSDEPSEKTPEFPPIPSNSNGNNNSTENQAQTNLHLIKNKVNTEWQGRWCRNSWICLRKICSVQFLKVKL